MVKCKDCAMLGLLDNTGQRVPFSMRTRSTGNYLDQHSRSYGVVDIYCWRRERDFDSENLYNSKEMVESISKDVDCQKFVPLVPGTTPIEVEDMMLRDSVAKLQQEMVALQKDAEIDRIKAGIRLDKQFRTGLVVQFLLALLAGAVVLIGDKILPFWTIQN